jgi:hypothetical protein
MTVMVRNGRPFLHVTNRDGRKFVYPNAAAARSAITRTLRELSEALVAARAEIEQLVEGASVLPDRGEVAF